VEENSKVLMAGVVGVKCPQTSYMGGNGFPLVCEAPVSEEKYQSKDLYDGHISALDSGHPSWSLGYH